MTSVKSPIVRSPPTKDTDTSISIDVIMASNPNSGQDEESQSEQSPTVFNSANSKSIKRRRPPKLQLDDSKDVDPKHSNSQKALTAFPALRTPKDMVLQGLALECVSPGFNTSDPEFREAIAASTAVAAKQRQIIAKRLRVENDDNISLLKPSIYDIDLASPGATGGAEKITRVVVNSIPSVPNSADSSASSPVEFMANKSLRDSAKRAPRPANISVAAGNIAKFNTIKSAPFPNTPYSLTMTSQPKRGPASVISTIDARTPVFLGQIQTPTSSHLNTPAASLHSTPIAVVPANLIPDNAGNLPIHSTALSARPLFTSKGKVINPFGWGDLTGHARSKSTESPAGTSTTVRVTLDKTSPDNNLSEMSDDDDDDPEYAALSDSEKPTKVSKLSSKNNSEKSTKEQQAKNLRSVDNDIQMSPNDIEKENTSDSDDDQDNDDVEERAIALEDEIATELKKRRIQQQLNYGSQNSFNPISSLPLYKKQRYLELCEELWDLFHA